MSEDIMYSFIVPVFNSEKYISETIDSILGQKTEYRFEIVVVDDGSTDNSYNIVEEYKDKNGDIIMLSQENRGAAAARNIGIKAAKGKWIICVDSDDTIDEHFLWKLDMAIKNASENTIIVVDNLLKYEDGRTVIEEAFRPAKRRTGSMINDIIPNACAKVLSRNLIMDNNLLFPEGLYFEDIAWFPLVAARCTDYIWINEPLYIYRQRDNSVSHDRDMKKMEYVITAVDYCRKEMKKNNLYRKNYLYMEAYVALFALALMCSEVIGIDSESPLAKKIRRYVRHYYPAYMSNPYVLKMSLRNRLYLQLIDNCKFKLLNLIIKIKYNIKLKMKLGILNKVYRWYNRNAI